MATMPIPRQVSLGVMPVVEVIRSRPDCGLHQGKCQCKCCQFDFEQFLYLLVRRHICETTSHWLGWKAIEPSSDAM